MMHRVRICKGRTTYMPTLDHLQRSFQCGRLVLKNRITAAPIFTGLEFKPNLSELTKFYVHLAEDGVSMVTICAGLVHSSGAPSDIWHVFNEDIDVPRHRALTNKLQEHSCKAVLQLVHAGYDAQSWPAWGPNTIKFENRGSIWRAPNLVIKSIIRGYIKTAQLAQKAGYSGVEVHAAGRTLPAAFLSPAINHRRDIWGATQLARFKFVLDIVRGVRKTIAPNMTIGVRFNLMELTPRGADWEEILRFTQMLRIAGADYLCPEFGGPEDRIPTYLHPTPKDVWLPSCQILAENTPLAVIYNEDLGSLEDAAEALVSQDNMLVAFGRPLVADYQFLRKSQGLIQADIRPWIEHTEYARIDGLRRKHTLFCLTAPFSFNTYPKSFVPATKKKRIVVLGGGISGIFFALTAARRGHFVQLFEKQDFLGGSVRFVEKIGQSEKIKAWLKLLENDLKLAEVEVHLNAKADINYLMSLKGIDLVVNATGSEPEIPDIPGIDSSNVVTYEELLGDNLPVGNRVAVLGINPVSVTVCRYLLEQLEESEMSAEQWRKAWGIGDIRYNKGGVLGVVPEVPPPLRQVYLVESQRGQFANLVKKQTDRWELQWLLMRGAQTMRDINIESIDNHALRASYGERHEDRYAVRVDHVVVCCGAVPNSELSLRLAMAGIDVLNIGAVTRESGYMSLYEAIHVSIEAALDV